MVGKIFNIQKFCTSDGPGIRTTVFFMGCPLRCLWCHNPESQTLGTQLMYDSEKCVNCLKCVDRCKTGCHSTQNDKHILNTENCTLCGECTSNLCKALFLNGYEISTDAIVNEVMKDSLFYKDTGGVTLSGGEPFFQSDFCLELLKKLKAQGLSVCVETCGYVEPQLLKASADYIDIYLFDYKETNPEKHKKFTGADNSLIIENLKLLNEIGKKIILRCPIIPGYNDTDEHFSGILNLANSLDSIIGIELVPYHSYGESKYSSLQRDYALKGMAVPTDKTVDLWILKLSGETNKPVSKA